MAAACLWCLSPTTSTKACNKYHKSRSISKSKQAMITLIRALLINSKFLTKQEQEKVLEEVRRKYLYLILWLVDIIRTFRLEKLRDSQWLQRDPLQLYKKEVIQIISKLQIYSKKIRKQFHILFLH